MKIDFRSKRKRKATLRFLHGRCNNTCGQIEAQMGWILDCAESHGDFRPLVTGNGILTQLGMIWHPNWKVQVGNYPGDKNARWWQLKYFLKIYPYLGQIFFNLTDILSDGLVQPPTTQLGFDVFFVVIFVTESTRGFITIMHHHLREYVLLYFSQHLK